MEDEISLLDYYRILKKRRKAILLIVLVITFGAVVYSLVAPKIYRSEASILTLESDGGSGGIAAMAASFTGLPLGSGSQSSMSKLVVLLKSRTLAERVIDRLDLEKFFYKDLWDFEKNDWKDGIAKNPDMEDIVGTFSSAVDIKENIKKGTIDIGVELADPSTAANVANAIVYELGRLINQNAFTMAKKQRIFIEGQLVNIQKELLLSGKYLSEYYQSNKISASNPRIDVVLPTNKGSKVDRFSMAGMRDVNLGLIEQLVKEKQKVDKKIKDVEVVKDIPQQVYLEHLILKKTILGQLNGLLHNQYVLAKIEEAKEEISFQVIDEARVPKKRFKPKRRQIVMIALFMGLLLGAFYAIFREYIDKMRKQEERERV